jgi:hypothetical protein
MLAAHAEEIPFAHWLANTSSPCEIALGSNTKILLATYTDTVEPG